MTIKVAIKHRTTYHFDRIVQIFPHVIRLRPAPHSRTSIESYSLKVKPEKHFINWQQDPFGNYLARFVFPEKAKLFSIDVELIADMTVINPFDFFLEEEAEAFPFTYEEQLSRDLKPYLEIKENGPLLKKWLAAVDRAEHPTVNFLVNLNQRLQQDIGYLIRMEAGVQTCEETLANRSGSCRDSAWLLVQILRHLGLAARFVSGYLVQLTADIKALDGPAGPEKDFTDLHAWAEVFLPGAGWIGLDPTSGLFAAEGHIPLACTPSTASAAPVTGSIESCEVDFTWLNQVTRIHEDSRVTKPYTEQQWRSIVSLGNKIERELKREDVRLTMGGEPTFVSIDDMEGEEWNSAALSPEKRKLAGQLFLQLRDKFAPNGLMHFGQGKWYPGEPLPRWALSLFWRSDGKPIWEETQWLSDESRDHGHDAKQAEKFIHSLATELDVDPAFIVPGYEDVIYYAWKEGRLPENVDPLDNKLNDPLERTRLQKLFARKLESVQGYALPLKWQEKGKQNGFWKSSPWPFRTQQMFLIPGDSAMGLRLPLDSLPWKLPDPLEFDAERDPFEERDELPDKSTRRTKKSSGKKAKTAREVIHTALCVEARNGRLYAFLPPQTHLENYLDIIHAIERTAGKLKLPIVIEGYEPPKDPRLKLLQITPDPGVIEVNVHPASHWKELINITDTLYHKAREVRLGTEKFMLDGRHSGTGGGNHVTLGGPTAADSPFLRRPDLLRSLITYWQQHPSLSYLFSGLFIGPTSQAPRVDEARDDNLYELEIALKLLTEGESKQPWLVDRILRNFLVDLTGNTHRSEFCIDKLYSPDSPVGRRGLVEFRAFEMPPHAQMSLVQMLLLRCLISRFWQKPYKSSLIRWGTELHDRFMLPHYVWEDMKLVVQDLRDAGYKFELDWFSAFREFRFPFIGSINANDMQLNLHSALEPWHVLGEEAAGTGMARYVDSSVERLQVSTYELAGDRYVITCNGRKVPLRPTGIKGKLVAGIRFKAWQQHSSLHPTIKPHTPLVFDIVDTENERSIAGCTYHVSHPGGRSYDTFPVNASEAEARRHARFWKLGQTQGKMRIPAEVPHPDQPFTLDLRVPPAKR